MVAGVRWTGSAGRRAPPVTTRIGARTKIATAGSPIASHRRLARADADAAGPGSRLMRSWARSASFAPMAPILTLPARARRAGSDMHQTVGWWGVRGGARGAQAPAGSGGGLPSTGPRAAAGLSRAAPSGDDAAGGVDA